MARPDRGPRPRTRAIKLLSKFAKMSLRCSRAARVLSTRPSRDVWVPAQVADAFDVAGGAGHDASGFAAAWSRRTVEAVADDVDLRLARHAVVRLETGGGGAAAAVLLPPLNSTLRFEVRLERGSADLGHVLVGRASVGRAAAPAPRRRGSRGDVESPMPDLSGNDAL